MSVEAFATLPHYLDHLAPLDPWVDRWVLPPSLAASPDLSVVAHATKGTVRNVVLGASRGPLLVCSWQDYRRVRDLRRPIVYLEHGYGQQWADVDSPGYPGGPGRDRVAVFLVPNGRVADAYRSRYPNADVHVIGSPRVEHLARVRGDGGELVAYGWHWNCPLVPETRSTFPEYRDAVARAARRWPTVGHGHPKDWTRFADWYRRQGIRSEHRWEKVIAEAGVYVCDGSSTIFEACAVGLPVVLLNGRDWRRDVHHGQRYWEWSDVGPNVDRPADLEAAIFEVICADRWADRRAQVAGEAYEIIDGAAEAAGRILTGIV